MSREYISSIDWLKAIGLTLIVVGHVADAAVLTLLPPIYPKQIGVALFLYAAGYGLAREQRPIWQVLTRRLFDIYLFGLAAAALLSVIGYIHDGNLLESNYLPFAGGINVALDYFPANPTTWFIGAYLHILLVWAILLRRIEIGAGTLAVMFTCEILLRASLIQSAGAFVAYMNVSNWITVFALGMMEGRRRDVTRAYVSWASAVSLCGFIAVWTTVLGSIPRTMGFPFMTIALPAEWSLLSILATSAAVSTLYLVCTLLTVRLVAMLPASAVVRFVARHTLIVFIGHMPVYYAMQSVVTAATSAYWGRVFLHLIVCYLGLLILSEAVHRLLERVDLRNRVLGLLTPQPQSVRVPEASL
jgi:peptidoglycan/LPS O-acetylase OafA/YrhL